MKSGRGEPVGKVQPKLPVIEGREAFIAKQHGIRDDHHAPRTEWSRADHARTRRVRLLRRLPRDPRVAFRHAPARPVKTRARRGVTERRIGRGHGQNPLGIFMRARRAIEDFPVLDPQPRRREQLVQIVAVFVVLVFRDDEQPAARAHPRQHVPRFLRRKRGRVPRSRPLPARIARMREHEHVRPGERLRRQRRVDVSRHGKIPPRQLLRRALVGGVRGVFRLHLTRAPGGDRPAFAVEFVEEHAREFSLREVRFHTRKLNAPRRFAATISHGQPSAARSLSTMICTSFLNFVCGSQPSFAFAFAGSPMSKSTSAGRS